MATIDMSGAATTAEKVVEDVMKIEPTIIAGVGMFVPGAAPIVAAVQPWIVFAAPYLERALNDVAASNGGDVMSGIIEILQHISKGQPNSTVLAPAEATSNVDSTRMGG